MTARRNFSPELKVRVVIEMINGKRLNDTSREYGIKDTILSRWKQEFLERAPQVFGQPITENQAEERIGELERMVRRLTMQLDMAKNLGILKLDRGGKRKIVKHLVKTCGYPVDEACELMELPRSTYYYYCSQPVDETELEKAIALRLRTGLKVLVFGYNSIRHGISSIYL